MTHPHGWHGAWLATASFIAGGLNAVAGGGSLLSFPSLLGFQVPPINANATNTVALWPGQASSIAGYFAEIKIHHKLLLPVCSAAIVGGVMGAIMLLRTSQATFMSFVPWLLLFAASLFAISAPVSRRLLSLSAKNSDKRVSVLLLWLGVAVVSLYIGYFGAGAGLLLMSVLTILGVEHIRQVNALKVVGTTCANGIAVVTFIAGRHVLWQYCLPMMLTGAIGGFLGARYSRRLNPQLLRSAVVLIGMTMAAYFFWKNHAGA